MNESIQIFMEYKVKEANIAEYESLMKKILTTLRDYDATDIEWFVASDQPHLYVEMFKMPTKSHYHALKKLRCDEEHHLFGQLIPYIEGGVKKIHCWAFQKKESLRW